MPVPPNEGTAPDGGQSRDLLTNPKAQDSFDKARERVNVKAEEEIAMNDAINEAISEGEIRGEEMVESFDLDKFIKEANDDAEKFETDLEEATKIKEIRKNGLNDEQKTKLDEIKQRVAERSKPKEGDVPVEGTSVTPEDTPPTTETPPAAAATATTETPPDKPADGEDPNKPDTPPVEGVDPDKLTEVVSKAVTEQLKPIQDELAATKQAKAELEEKLQKAQEVTKEIKEDRDALKKKTNFNRFSKAAGISGIPEDLHEFAHQKAQAIANEAGKELSFTEIFEALKESSPSLFPAPNTKSDKDLEVKPGATGTGSGDGGAPKSTAAPKLEKATTFDEARSNLRARLENA